MKWKKIGVTASAAALLATGLVVGGAALSASAHTPTVTNDCIGVQVDAKYYSASVPANPGQPEIDPTPGTPAVPGTPEVPATYVQEFKFVFKGHGQHDGDKFEWHAADWTEPGWQKTGEHRDSTTILTPEVPATPGTPAVPGTPGQPYIAPTDAKTNHVEVWTDGNVRADQDFSTTFSGWWQYGDQNVGHTYRVVISSWDGIGNLDTGTVDVAACHITPPIGITKPVATVLADNCIYDPNGVPIERAQTLTFDNTASNVSVDFTVKDYPQFDRTVAAGETTQVKVPFATFPSGTLHVSAAGETFDLVVDACPLPSPKPPSTTTTTSKDEVDCATNVVTTTTTTWFNDWYLLLNDDGKLTWEQTNEITGYKVTHRTPTAAECPVVTPPVVTPPTQQTTPPATTIPAAPVSEQSSDTQVLAHTGEDIPVWLFWLGLSFFVLAAAALVGALAIRKRNRNAE